MTCLPDWCRIAEWQCQGSGNRLSTVCKPTSINQSFIHSFVSLQPTSTGSVFLLLVQNQSIKLIKSVLQ